MGSDSDAENAPAEPKADTEQAESTAPDDTAKAHPAENDDAPAEPKVAEAEPSGEAPRKKKKKKKKRAAVEPEERRERGPVYAADGSERPAFVLDFPDDPELAKVTAAFEAGNYAYVREHAPELAERSENAAVKRAATELLARIEPDPLIRFLLGVSVLLLLFLTYYAYANHGH